MKDRHIKDRGTSRIGISRTGISRIGISRIGISRIGISRTEPHQRKAYQGQRHIKDRHIKNRHIKDRHIKDRGTSRIGISRIEAQNDHFALQAFAWERRRATRRSKAQEPHEDQRHRSHKRIKGIGAVSSHTRSKGRCPQGKSVETHTHTHTLKAGAPEVRSAAFLQLKQHMRLDVKEGHRHCLTSQHPAELPSNGRHS